MEINKSFVQICLIFIYIFHSQVQCQPSTAATSFYIAGVLEFPILSPSYTPMETRQRIEQFRVLIEAASPLPDIIVFPEKVFNNRTHPVIVPSPDQQVIPCARIDYDFAISELSCYALSLQVYLLINVVELENCTAKAAACPIYNTNVVFDRHGMVISRYRKYNLLGSEWQYYNYTTYPEMDATFSTDFNVTFGHFTRMDLLYYRPAQTLIAQGITDFLHPSQWQSELPFMSGNLLMEFFLHHPEILFVCSPFVQFLKLKNHPRIAMQLHQAWAYTNDVNLLVAGTNDPKNGRTGTGIYAGQYGALLASMTTDETKRKLHISVLKKKEYRKMSSSAAKSIFPKVIATQAGHSVATGQSGPPNQLALALESKSESVVPLIAFTTTGEVRKQFSGMVMQPQQQQQQQQQSQFRNPQQEQPPMATPSTAQFTDRITGIALGRDSDIDLYTTLPLNDINPNTNTNSNTNTNTNANANTMNSNSDTVEIDNSQVIVQQQQVCSKDLCCNFHIKRSAIAKNQTLTGDDPVAEAATSALARYQYRLAAYDGMGTFLNTEPDAAGVCAIIACVGDHVHTCGHIFPEGVIVENHFTFDFIQITASFSHTGKHLIMPSGVDGMLMPLPVDTFDWQLVEKSNYTFVNYTLLKPKADLLTFGIYVNYFLDETIYDHHQYNLTGGSGTSWQINIRLNILSALAIASHAFNLRMIFT